MKSKRLVIGMILTALSIQAIQPAFAAPNTSRVVAYHVVSGAVGGIIALSTYIASNHELCPYGFHDTPTLGGPRWVSYQQCSNNDSNGRPSFSSRGGPNALSTAAVNIAVVTAAAQAIPYAILLGQACMEKFKTWHRSGIQDPESSLRNLEAGEALPEGCVSVAVVPCKVITKEMVQVYKAPLESSQDVDQGEKEIDNPPTYESIVNVCSLVASGSEAPIVAPSVCYAEETIAILEALPEPSSTLPTVTETTVVSEEPYLLAE